MIEYIFAHELMILAWLLSVLAVSWMFWEIRTAPECDDNERPIRRRKLDANSDPD